MKRTLLCCAVALAAATMASCGGAQASKQRLQIGDGIAVVQTGCGQVQGYILDDIYTFLGIPYGAPTSGENRFRPPQPPAVWDGIRMAVYYGNCAPQNDPNYNPASLGTFRDHWNYSTLSEDCLNLNVWTPQPDAQKRPVMVWFHGGGFSAGNGIEHDGYNGANLSRYGDVVFVSINHRLNVFAFSDFSATGDERFAYSGNAGFLDMVAALQWVHDNIANFGGDPDNVTIMGQSGGGAKVSNLVASPDTKGLVHKAVALSGNAVSALDQSYTRRLGEFILSKAGGDITKLQQMPWREYLALANSAAAEFATLSGAAGNMRGGFGPIADGVHLPAGTFYTDVSQHSNSIPMLFCTTSAESSPSANNAALEDITFEGLPAAMRLDEEKGTAVVEAYRKAYPDEKPIQLLARYSSSRERVVASADAKSVQAAPVYMTQFCWEPNLLNGRMRAFHCIDICFWYYNTDLMVSHTGGTESARALSKKMADALLAFMRTGDPNTKGMPLWPAYTPEKGEMMVLNDQCKVLADPDREVRAILSAR